jgi:hypothetical protein
VKPRIQTPEPMPVAWNEPLLPVPKIGHMLPRTVPVPDGMDLIQRHVCATYGLTIEQLHSRARPKELAWARQLAMAMSRELLHLSSTTVAEHFKRDHATVLYATNLVRDFCEVYPQVAAAVSRLRTELKDKLKKTT